MTHPLSTSPSEKIDHNSNIDAIEKSRQLPNVKNELSVTPHPNINQSQR